MNRGIPQYCSGTYNGPWQIFENVYENNPLIDASKIIIDMLKDEISPAESHRAETEMIDGVITYNTNSTQTYIIPPINEKDL